MSATVSDPKSENAPAANMSAPKPIVNAQTVCNEKNEKGKLCNGHLKQLHTAGEAAKVHLRGDDVLFKCQTCGTLYMGPPLGHVRDPYKQHRFVEAELTALLEAAGGRLPVIKKNEKGVYVIVEPAAEPPAPKPAAPKVASAAPAASAPKPAAAAPAPAKAAGHKLGQNPNRQLFKRSTYGGVVDTGPVPGESFAQKVERLGKVSAGAKLRAETGGGDVAVDTDSSPAADLHSPATEAQAETGAAAPSGLSSAATTASPIAGAETPADLTAPATHTGSNPNRALFRRSTYCGVKDTGPVAGESFEQKVERLQALSAAAKQRAEEAG